MAGWCGSGSRSGREPRFWATMRVCRSGARSGWGWEVGAGVLTGRIETTGSMSSSCDERAGVGAEGEEGWRRTEVRPARTSAAGAMVGRAETDSIRPWASELTSSVNSSGSRRNNTVDWIPVSGWTITDSAVQNSSLAPWRARIRRAMERCQFATDGAPRMHRIVCFR